MTFSLNKNNQIYYKYASEYKTNKNIKTKYSNKDM